MKKGLFTALIAFWALLFTAASAGAFFVNGQIWNTHRTDGLYTNIDISFGSDFPGVPETDVTAITVEGPSGLLYDKADFEYLDQFSCWSLATPGAPEIGEYTFTVTTASDSGTDTDFQGVIRTIPVPDIGTFSPVNVTSKTPKFSWGPVDYSKTPVYYRLVISKLDETWLYFTSRTLGMLSWAAPLNLLQPGTELKYRVECHDSPDFNILQNRSQSDWVPFTMAGTLNHSAIPAIDLDTWGAVTYSFTNSTDLYCWVKVIDHDGVSYDGTSHSVSVTAPNGTTTYPLNFSRARSATEGYYDVYVGLDGSPAQAGKYIFTVTDPDWNEGTSTDSLTVDPLDPPDEASFTPTSKNEYITASFDNVYVNGELYDDFNDYTSIGELADFGLWWWWGGTPTCASIIDNSGDQAVQFTVNNPIGSQVCSLLFADPASINSIRADITVHDATGGAVAAIPPRARIMGTFYNNGIEDIYAHISVTKDKVYYFVWGNSSPNTAFATGDLKTGISLGQTVNAAISWDGATLSFEADDGIETYTATYTPAGIVNDPAEPYKRIDADIFLRLLDTTPTFTWNPVTDASRYRVRIYSGDNSRTVWSGYPGNQIAYTIPPGALAPDTTYTYRIEAWDTPDPLDVDNVSKTPAYNYDNYMFITGEQAVDPFIDLSSTGVHIWNNEPVDPYLSFWIKVHDAQGVPGDIKSVTVQLPGGAEEFLYYDYSESPTCGIYRTDSFLDIEDGVYTFRVNDKGGHFFEVTEELTPADPTLGYPAATSLTHTVVNDTAVDFDWDDVTGAAFYQLEIYDEDFRRVYTFPTTVSEYYVPAGLLEENALYRCKITTRAEFYSDNVDNGSSSPWMSWMWPTFMTGQVTGGSSSPSINLDNWGAHIVHYKKPGSTDSIYMLLFAVKVTDLDGVPENIDYVRVDYPDGITTRDLHYIERISATEGTYVLMESYENFGNIPQGDFSFAVTDSDGNLDEVTDEMDVTAVLPIPTNCAPVQDSTVIGTTPTISWDTVTGAQSYTVRIFDEGDNIIYTSPFLTVNNYEVPAGILEVGKTYSYRISAYQEDGALCEIDNSSSHPLFASERHHFTVGNTETGGSVTVEPVDETTETTPVTVTFDSVYDEGTTELTTSEEGSAPPEGFMLGDPPTYYEITTTAEVSGTIEVCVDYTGVSYENEGALRFYHYENGEWVDVTSSLDTENDIICGIVNSLSAFAIFEFEGAQYCTTLGDDPKPSILDQDIFTFEGTEDEEVSIKMEANPSGSSTGNRATLILRDRISGVRLVQRDRSGLPNEINVTLPATGEYCIIVEEQPRWTLGTSFNGDYCLSIGSSEGLITLEPTGCVE